MPCERPADLVRALIRRGYEAVRDEAGFEEAALAVHARQRAGCPAIARLAPQPPRSWREIPLVPASLFASHTMACFDPGAAVAVFTSSGTTATARSRHLFRDLSLYREASLAGAHWLMGDGPWRIVNLVEPRPESSLYIMSRWMEEEWGSDRDGEPSIPRAVIGAAFTFVALIERREHRPLPSGSIVIETGGYKGRSRAIPREELHAGISLAFNVPLDRVAGEYGMCEISSPAWSRLGAGPVFRIPSWVRVRTLDPETMEDAPRGLVAIYDPANLDSSVGVLTADVGSLRGDDLVLEGRLPGAAAKGCSLEIPGS